MFKEHLLQKINQTPTPFYYYDIELLKKTLQQIKEISEKYNFVVHYALKANFNTRILNTIKEYGLGADCVSGNEVKKAIEVGFSPDKVVFAGVGKSDKEIIEALNNDIFCFNVESVQELGVINGLAAAAGKKANIASSFTLLTEN